MNFFNIGPLELILIMVVVLIVFGPSKLPEVGRALGKAIREFREMSREVSTQFTESMEMLEVGTKESAPPKEAQLPAATTANEESASLKEEQSSAATIANDA